MIDICNIAKSYRGPDGPVAALDDVSIRVDNGDFLAIQGPSGCGKSTLLLSVGTLLTPDRGIVSLDGIDPYTLPREKRAAFRANHIGFVFQEFFLLPYLTVLENVLVPSLGLAGTAADTERATSLLALFQLDHRTNHKPAELSSGERQRTAMARALFNNPTVLLADEPTGNLDRENERVVLMHLQDFARNGGAVLMVTHSERAAGHAFREVHLDHGRIINGRP